MSEYVAAIDLGTTKVVTIVGEKSAGGIKIVGYSEAPSSGVMRGEVVNIQKVLNSLMPTVTEAQQQVEDLGFQIKEVYVGIAGQNIRCDANSIKKHRLNPSELITKAEIHGMLQEMYQSRVNAGEEVLHVIPQSYNIDENMGIKDEDAVGMDGKEVDANYRIFIGRANSAAHSGKVITRTGLKLKKLILEPIASAEAILSPVDKELGVAMVDIGGGTTDLLVIHDNIIRHTAVIPFGGNSITEDIRQICGVSLKHAEALKKQHGSCISEYAPADKVITIKGQGGEISKEVSYKLLASAIEARVSEIMATVLYEIEKSGYKEKLGSGIVLTGGSANLNHIQNITRAITKLPVRIAFPDSAILMSTSRDEVYKPSASTAVGLIIKGFEYEEAEEEGIIQQAGETDLFGETLPKEEPKKDKKKNPAQKREKKNFKEMIGSVFEEIFNGDDNDA